MIKNSRLRIQDLSTGITLVEIIVVIFIISMFSIILIAGFPKIQKQFAFSRVTYKLAQDLRRVQDLGLSGVQINNGEIPARPITTIKGYGIYVNLNQPAQYIIYADINNNYKYDPTSSIECSKELITDPQTDCVIETVNVSKESSELRIKNIENIDGSYTSINFRPPSPTIDIDNIAVAQNPVGIVLKLASSATTRTVWVNTAGLINIQ